MKPTEAQDNAFYGYARWGTIARASRHGHGEMANLGRQLKGAETAVGAALLDHETGELTVCGEWYKQWLVQARAGQEAVLRRIHNYAHPGLRTASAELVNVKWLARVCRALERRDSNLRYSTHAACEDELHRLMEHGLVDLVVAAWNQGWHGWCHSDLVQIRLALLYPRRWGKITCQQLFAHSRITRRLYYSCMSETLRDRLDEGLAGLRLEWTERCCASSMTGVIQGVQEDDALGLVVDVADLIDPPGTRRIMLPFDPVTIAAIWPKKMSAKVAPAVAELQKAGRELPHG